MQTDRGAGRAWESSRASTSLRRFWLLTLCAALLLLAAPAMAQEGGGGSGEGGNKRAPTETSEGSSSPKSTNPAWMHGVTEGSWFYMGGGIGPTSLGPPSWQFLMGGTGYQPFFYAGGGFELAFMVVEGPWPSFQGNFHIGTIIPTAVLRPMAGFRVGGGMLLYQPHFDIGGQFGFALGDRDTETAFRFLVEPMAQVHSAYRGSVVSVLMLTFAVLN